MARGLTGVSVHRPLALTRSGSGPSLMLLFCGMKFCLLSTQARTFFNQFFFLSFAYNAFLENLCWLGHRYA